MDHPHAAALAARAPAAGELHSVCEQDILERSAALELEGFSERLKFDADAVRHDVFSQLSGTAILAVSDHGRDARAPCAALEQQGFSVRLQFDANAVRHDVFSQPGGTAILAVTDHGRDARATCAALGQRRPPPGGFCGLRKSPSLCRYVCALAYSANACRFADGVPRGTSQPAPTM